MDRYRACNEQLLVGDGMFGEIRTLVEEQATGEKVRVKKSNPKKKTKHDGLARLYLIVSPVVSCLFS
jgi:hypothetical protein